MSAIHHVTVDLDRGNTGGLPVWRFFELAERLPAYPGVMQLRVQEQQQRRPGNAGWQSGNGDRHIASDAATLAREFGDLVTVVQVP